MFFFWARYPCTETGADHGLKSKEGLWLRGDRAGQRLPLNALRSRQRAPRCTVFGFWFSGFPI